MKKLYILTITSFFYLFHGYSQEKTYLSEAVNLAGKQRMLGQRMAKDKLYIEAKSKNQVAEKELEETITTFEKNLEILKDFAPTEVLKYKVDIQEYVFKNYKETILDSSKKSMQEIIDTNSLFLLICDDLVNELIAYSKTKTDSSLNRNQKYILKNIANATEVSDKLRYLTQKLNLYFSMNQFEIRSVSPTKIDDIIHTLDTNLNHLTVLEFNTLEIDDALSEVHYYWTNLKNSLYENGIVNMITDKVTPEQLFDLCNSILEKANTVTKLYADLNKS